MRTDIDNQIMKTLGHNWDKEGCSELQTSYKNVVC